MKIIVMGEKNTDSPQARISVEKAIEKSGWREEIVELVTTKSMGIGYAARTWAEENNISIKLFYSHWDRNLCRAMNDRNREMGGYADKLIAIYPLPRDPTIHDMICVMERLGKPVSLYEIDLE